ncbi:MAG: zinc-ribbon domain-containing protein, partial [Myxococcota bacterium]
MNVTCPSCKTRYSVDDARVPPSGVTIKCPKCTHTFVAKPPAAKSAVALPGSVAPPSRGLSGARRSDSAVALPGNRAGSIAENETNIGDLDLGLDDDIPLPPSRPPSRNVPASPPPFSSPVSPAQTDRPALGGDDALDFISDKASMAQLEPPSGTPELKVRRRNGRVEGPFGVGRLQAMLRNRELQGSEDISEDGVSWRAMTSHPQLNSTLNEMHGDDALGFGNVELPSGDLGPPSLVGSRSQPGLSTGGLGTGSLDLSSDDLGSSDLGGARNANRPSGAYGFQPNAPGRGASMPDQPGAGDQTALSDDLGFGAKDGKASADVLDAAGRDLASELEVGDIPDLPPLWQTYKQQILGFTAAVVVVLIGVYTQFFTPVGFYGLPGLFTYLTTAAPPPPPPAPPPAPPKVADPRQIQDLIDEHSYESFRSVFATLQQAATSADNRLALAKARGLATLAFGYDVFALSALTTAVADLNTVDLSSAMNGDAAAANLAIAKARAALQMLGDQPDQAVEQLDGLVQARSDEKELALLLGLAYSQLNKHAKAVAAFDKALVADPKYAPALHAIGVAVEALGGDTAQKDAAAWFSKAIDANPRHSRSGIEAARLYEAQNKFGESRSILRKTAAHADRGLPPSQRPAFLYRVARLHDEQDRLQEATEYALEAA